MLFVELFTIQTIKTTTTAAAWQLQFWRKSWRLTRVDHAIAPNTSSLLRKLACARLPSEIRCLFCSEICFALCTGNRVGKGMLRAAARGKRWLHYSSGRPDKPTAASIRWPQEIWKKNWTKFLSQNTLNYTLYTGRGTQQSPHSTIKQQLTRWQKVFSHNESHWRRYSCCLCGCCWCCFSLLLLAGKLKWIIVRLKNPNSILSISINIHII